MSELRFSKLKLILILLQAASLFPQLVDALSTEKNEYQIQNKWADNLRWHTQNGVHNDFYSRFPIHRVYGDEHVAIYYDAEVNESSNNQSITWPFALITKAWRYTKDAYPYFEANPRLYVVIHSRQLVRGCDSGTYLEAKYGSRNVIDCGEEGPLTPTPLHSKFFYRLVTSFGHLVRRAANGLVNDADVDVCENLLQDIISADVFSNLTDPSGRVVEWLTERVQGVHNEVHWFRDWFIPIYQQFGGSSVINKYFNLTYTHLPRTSTNFDVSLSAGELVHFWSGAAGVDLVEVVAINAFRKTSSLYQDELIQARKSYPDFNYTVEDCDGNQFECGNGLCIQSFRRCNGIVECSDASDEANCTECSSTAFKCYFGGSCVPGSSRCDFKYDCPSHSDEWNCSRSERYSPLWLNGSVHYFGTPRDSSSYFFRSYVDGHLAVYTVEDDLSASQNNYPILSEAWLYLKKTYFVSRWGVPLILTFNRSTNMTHNKCVTSAQTYIHKSPPPRHIIQCGHLKLKEWDLNDSDTDDGNAKMMFHSLVSLVRFGKYGRVNNADSDVCGVEMLDIMTYDVISHLHGQSNNTLSWRNSFLSKIVNSRYCFRDWYLPIYESFGNSSILYQFYVLLNERWYYLSEGNYKVLLKVGQFVHFWSGTVQADLQELASHAFGWNRVYMDELLLARKSYDRLQYTLNEYQVMYADSDVAIYANNTIYHHSSQYTMLSNAWKYVRTQYMTISSGPCTLHVQVSTRTQDTTTTPPVRAVCPLFNESTLFKRPSHFLKIIDCRPPLVKESHAASDTFLDLTLAQMGELALKNSHGHGACNDWPASQVSGTTLNSILVYDIYLSLNDTKYTGSWILKQNEETMSFPRDGTFWFKDWYLQIYNNYGQSAVLTRLIPLVNSLKYDATPTRQMNMGEFVHTWSGAAETNLKKLARSVFGWNQTYEEQFIQARLDFQDFKYTCDTPNCDERQGSGNVAAITGVTISIFVLLIILIGFGSIIALDKKKIRRMSLRIRHLTNEEVDEFLNGNINLNDTDAHRPIHSLPFINKYEISPARLVINDNVTLGSGEFGIVKEGKLLAYQYSSSSDLTVAVKMVKPEVDVGYFKAFLAEIKIMAFLGHHENIASLLGTVTKNIRNCEVFVAMEYCSKGDLLQFVQANCDNFQDLFRPKFGNASQVLIMSGKSEESKAVVKCEKSSDSEEADQSVSVPVVSNENSPISTSDLLEWSRQISEGMSYLTLKKVIHGDMAARNVLLTGDNNAKICDFGLSRQLINYSRYLKESVGPLPWAWLAIECFSEKSFSVQSDIWAFGVTLWEIFTLGKFPYPGRTWNSAFVDDLTRGMRLTTPQYGNREIYNLMMNCMMHLPSERIPFSEINLELNRIKENLVSNPITPTTPNPNSAYVSLN